MWQKDKFAAGPVVPNVGPGSDSCPTPIISRKSDVCFDGTMVATSEEVEIIRKPISVPQSTIVVYIKRTGAMRKTSVKDTTDASEWTRRTQEESSQILFCQLLCRSCGVYLHWTRIGIGCRRRCRPERRSRRRKRKRTDTG